MYLLIVYMYVYMYMYVYIFSTIKIYGSLGSISVEVLMNCHNVFWTSVKNGTREKTHPTEWIDPIGFIQHEGNFKITD